MPDTYGSLRSSPDGGGMEIYLGGAAGWRSLMDPQNDAGLSRHLGDTIARANYTGRTEDIEAVYKAYDTFIRAKRGDVPAPEPVRKGRRIVVK